MKSLLLGVRFFPKGFPVILATTCFAKGSNVAAAAVAGRFGSASGSLVRLVGVALGTYVLARTLTWLPLAVDGRLSLAPAFRRGIDQTRGHVSEILLALFAIGILMLLLVLIVRSWPLAV